MDESDEDRISKLPESVVCHILSRLPSEDAIRTSALSNDWKHKWTSIYNIHIDEASVPHLRKTKRKDFLTFIYKILDLTRDRNIESFRLRCNGVMASVHLERWAVAVSTPGIQNFEITAYKCRGGTFHDDFYNCESLTKLKLKLRCTLFTSLMNKGFPNLKILSLGNGVKLIANAGDGLLNFPVLRELELEHCEWRGVKSVEINAPELTRLLVKGPFMRFHNRCKTKIKIYGPKLKKFECRGYYYISEEVVVTTASLVNADIAIAYLCRDQARALLNRFPATLEYLKLSGHFIVEALTSSLYSSLPCCFNKLKQLETYNHVSCKAMLNLIQGMPSLETLSLYKYHEHEYERNSSQLKVVILIAFGGTTRRLDLARYVLDHVTRLERLILPDRDAPFVSETEIEWRLSNFPNSSIRASVVIYEPESSF